MANIPVHESLLFTFGRPFSPVYSLIMRIRERLYSRDIIKRIKLPVPVVSVGNIVLGGTGKTPTVKFLAEQLLKSGCKPVIISRGYKGSATQPVNVVSDGEKILCTASESGDEPYMLASALPGVPVLTGAKRAVPSQYAVETLGADILILDDGFQHMAVKRTMDIVLFDGTFLAGNSRVFPGGVLREPVAALHRCSCFLITGKNKTNSDRIERFKELLEIKFPGKPVYISGTKASVTRVTDIANSNAKPTSYLAFSGIANPSRFIKTAESLKLDIAKSMVFPDHANYNQKSLDNICSEANKHGANHLLTTEKDYVKLLQYKIALPVSIVKITADPEQSFVDYFMAQIMASKNE